MYSQLMEVYLVDYILPFKSFIIYNYIMNIQYYNYIFLILIIIFSLYGSLLNHSHEGFTPYIRSLYKPHLRNARIMYEKHSTNLNNTLHKYARNFGLY